MDIERNRKYQREWAARKRAVTPAAQKAASKRYREKNREALRRQSRETYHGNIEKSREYAREWQAAKYKFVADLKVERGCADCGFNKHADALQFDHIPGLPKLFNIGPAIRSKGKQAVMNEIAKCEVRCANCHAIKTAQRRVESKELH